MGAILLAAGIQVVPVKAEPATKIDNQIVQQLNPQTILPVRQADFPDRTKLVAKQRAEAGAERARLEAVAAQRAVVSQPAQPSGGAEQWRPLVAKYFPVGQVNYALAIMGCESGGNPGASSPTNDHGLFQIHGGLQTYGPVIYDPEFNIRLAYQQYYAPRGWQPWSCSWKV